MPSRPNEPILERILREERELVYAFGGYALEFSGGALVTNERLPVPRFNFVQDVRVARDRMAAFFERALDHYFQRALRPTFRVPDPVPLHVDTTLRRLGFLPTGDGWSVLAGVPERAEDPTAASLDVVVDARGAGEHLANRWAPSGDRAEFCRAVEVLADHPNPGERLEALVGRENGRTVASALVYVRDDRASVHAVTTEPDARGRGIATGIVAQACRRLVELGSPRTLLLSEVGRLEERLAPFGLHRVGHLEEYRLPTDVALVVPPPGPAAPPRWRPPRGANPLTDPVRRPD